MKVMDHQPGINQRAHASVEGATRDHKDRYKKILFLSFPIMGGMVSQNVLNLVDTAMVGNLGDAALAAVGIGSFANFTFFAFITGLSSGVQAMAARRMGEQNQAQAAHPLNAGLVLSFLIGIPLTILLFFLIPFIFPFLNQDPQVIALGVPYLQARLVGMVAIGMNFSFRGYFNGIHHSGFYLRTIIMMHLFNIFFNYLLINGHWGFPKFGTLGSGVATTLATFLGIFYYFYLGMKHCRPNGFLARFPSKESLKNLLKLSVPTGIQQTFFAAGLAALFWIIGRVGTSELAAAQVLVSLILLAILPGIGMGLASASLVSQALGRNKPADAKQWGWETVKVGILFLTLIGLPMVLVPQLLLSVFIHEPSTLELAILPLRIIGATIGLEAVGLILMNSLLGAGDSRRVMVVTIITQWILFLPLAYLVGPVLGFGLLGVWLVQIGYRFLQASLFSVLWWKGRWAHIRV